VQQVARDGRPSDAEAPIIARVHVICSLGVRLPVLVVNKPGLPSAYVEIATDRLRIGRAAECEIVLPSQFVSRLHAEVRAANGSFVLVDLGSSNGTMLNGRQVEANVPQPLQDGDSFTIEEFSLGFVSSHDAAATLVRNRRAPDQLYVDVDAMEVWIGQRLLGLKQARVLKLLAYLYVNRSRVCSEDELGNHVWPPEPGSSADVPLFDSSSLYQLIYLARRAIETTPRRPRYLVNVPGLGYRLYDLPQAEAGDSGSE
jgi:DNA-binding response OmpR family regulator